MYEYPVFVKIIDLPLLVKGFVRFKDDCYTVVINAKSSRSEQEKTFQHEFSHIHHGHLFKKEESIEKQEKEADNNGWDLSSSPEIAEEYPCGLAMYYKYHEEE